MFFVLAAITAVVDWIAVARDSRRTEYVAKPATTLLLTLAAVALDPHSAPERVAVVVGLALCLAGDVFLMLPSDRFVPGLTSFLLGHIAFVVGFVLGRGDDPLWGLTIAAAVVALAVSGPQVLRGAAAQDLRLRVPVAAYMGVIGTMLAASALPANRLAIVGAAIFVLSDSILARNKFVRPFAHAHLATMVTYHAALAFIVLSLV